jgi:hypothetical protein
MAEHSSGKKQAQSLQGIWDSMVKSERLHPEIAYRIEKLYQRMDPLADKIFFKTVKAHEMLAECRQQTHALQQQLDNGGERTFLLLTQLEKTFEDLLSKTYAFRIKAG